MIRWSGRWSIKTHPSNSPALIRGNFVEIKQAIDRILENSVEAMPRGGEVVVTVGVMDRNCEIQVEDTGDGMNPQVLQKCLNALYTTKANGTGLGLTACVGDHLDGTVGTS